MIRILRQVLPPLFAVTVVVTTLYAQHDDTRSGDGIIQIHVVGTDNRPVNMRLWAELVREPATPVARFSTDSGGLVTFHVASDGGYYVKVSGSGIEDATSQRVEFENLEHTPRELQIVFLTVKSKGGDAQNGRTSSGTGETSNAPVTSAAELRVPQSARKAFDKGMTAWQKQDYQKAAEEFEKAVADYPEYDTAYNNLGVMYAHLNQNDKAMAAFKRSVELNDKNADADRNLARMFLREKNFPQAEELLKKCLAVQPADAATLTMLAIAEIEDGKVDDALRDARRVHDLPHQGYSVAHYVAGQALEDKHEYQQAKAEYETYLKESPNGPDVAQVKSALDRLSAANGSAAPKAQ